MNQGILEVVNQEMATVNVDILGISELKWTGIGESNSDDHYIYYCGQEYLRRNGVALRVNKRGQNPVLGCNLKNDRIISVHFQGKPFNIKVIQVYAPNSNAEEAEVERFCEDLQDLLELIPKTDVLFIIGDWNAKLGSKEIRQSCILSPCLFNVYAEYIMRNTGLDEAQAGIKIAGRNINSLRYADDTTLMAESEEELKSLLKKVKEESEKVGLKLNIQKTKIMASVSSFHGK